MGQQQAPRERQFEFDQQIAAIESGQESDAAAASIARNREARENKRNLAYGAGTAVLTAAGGVVGGPAGAAGGAAGGNAIQSATKKYT